MLMFYKPASGENMHFSCAGTANMLIIIMLYVSIWCRHGDIKKINQVWQNRTEPHEPTLTDLKMTSSLFLYSNFFAF